MNKPTTHKPTTRGVSNSPTTEIESDVYVESVEVQDVVTNAPQPIPDEFIPPHPAGGAVVEESVGPRVVTENERVRVEDDGSVSRRVDRVEHEPPVRQRRSPNIVPALLVILALALGAIAGAWYLSRPDTKPVPAVEGLALDEAVTRVENDGFKTDIVSQPNDAAEGTVFRQNPGAGTEREKGSDVQLLVSKGPADVAIPNAVGVSEAEARDRLAAKGLQASVVRVYSERPDGEVVAQSPAAGSRAAKETAVRLNVSKGSAVASVPSVVGTPQADATAQLEDAGFQVNVVSVPSAEAAGTVVAQNPIGGTAQRGSSVRLNVSRGP